MLIFCFWEVLMGWFIEWYSENMVRYGILSGILLVEENVWNLMFIEVKN